MAQVHGASNVTAGLWPMVHLRSFEAVFGPRPDRWLEYTVARLLTSIRFFQLRAATPEDWPTPADDGRTLLSIDVIYVPRGRIRWTNLIVALEEAALIAGWALVSTEDDGQ